LRRDYLAANKARRVVTPGFILLVRPRGDDDAKIRAGYTVTKKIGGAVVRNRMKRRFRALARALLPGMGLAGADHVLIGRDGGNECDFANLQADFIRALAKVTK
jgi:ribonuclease P protein component